MSSILVVTAMEKEASPRLYEVCHVQHLVTGIGTRSASIQLTKYLLEHPEITHVINLGYVGGSTAFTVGEPCIVRHTAYRDYDVDIYERTYDKNLELPPSVDFLREVDCLTGDSFYTGGPLTTSSNLLPTANTVYDMELAVLAQVIDEIKPSIKLISLKIVSDTCNTDQYQSVDTDSLTTTLNDLASRVIDEINAGNN